MLRLCYRRIRATVSAIADSHFSYGKACACPLAGMTMTRAHMIPPVGQTKSAPKGPLGSHRDHGTRHLSRTTGSHRQNDGRE